MDMTPRKRNGLTLVIVGIVLMMLPQPLMSMFGGSVGPYTMAFFNFLSPLGLIFLVLGGYRIATGDKET